MVNTFRKLPDAMSKCAPRTNAQRWIVTELNKRLIGQSSQEYRSDLLALWIGQNERDKDKPLITHTEVACGRATL